MFSTRSRLATRVAAALARDVVEAEREHAGPPRALPPVRGAVRIFLDEAVPGQRAQVVAARRGGEAGYLCALGRRRGPVQPQVRPDRDPPLMGQGPHHPRVGELDRVARHSRLDALDRSGGRRLGFLLIHM
jgi:hypothetical protein